MKYLMLINEPADKSKMPSPEALGRIMEAVGSWHEDLMKRGIATECWKMARPDKGKWISRQNGALAVTDGPFAESREVLGGFVVLEAKDIEEAVALAKGFPPLTMGVKVEVRPVLADEDIPQG